METDIINYDGVYTITPQGDIYSYKQKKKRKLKPQKASQSKKGYFQVRLFEVGGGDVMGKLQYVHRLVWETFKGDIPEGKQIDHIDGDTSNNSIDNLQVLTPRKNMDKYNRNKWGPTIRDRRDEFIKLYKELGTYKKVSETTGIAYQRIYRTIKDVIHYRDSATGKYKTRRYSDIDDEFTNGGDRRRFNKPPQNKKRDDKGRFMPD